MVPRYLPCDFRETPFYVYSMSGPFSGNTGDYFLGWNNLYGQSWIVLSKCFYNNLVRVKTENIIIFWLFSSLFIIDFSSIFVIRCYLVVVVNIFKFSYYELPIAFFPVSNKMVDWKN